MSDHNETWNCDVCGRLVNPRKDTGYHISTRGGFACTPCGEWAAKINLTCPTCQGKLAHGDYGVRCDCDHHPTITRSGRHYEVRAR